MIYHYTTISSLEGILKDVGVGYLMNFWATRYDFFEDKEEFRLGIDAIYKYLPQVEEGLSEDRKIAKTFKWSSIENNPNIPWPYVVSFTDRYDNDYMWENYADNNNGVALCINDNINVHVPDVPTIALKKCIYLENLSANDIVNYMKKEYFDCAFSFLGGPSKEIAFGLLKDYPQLFVQSIAMYFLSFVAPCIKRASFYQEEETRTILSIPIPEYKDILMKYPDIMNKININMDFILKEKTRVGRNNKEVKYREMKLPINILNAIYVHKQETKEQVSFFLESKGLSIPIILL